MPRLEPLPPGAVPGTEDIFAGALASGAFIPNSQRILQRKPAILRALRALGAAVMDPAGEVPLGFKRLLAYVVARVHGCHY